MLYKNLLKIIKLNQHHIKNKVYIHQFFVFHNKVLIRFDFKKYSCIILLTIVLDRRIRVIEDNLIIQCGICINNK